MPRILKSIAHGMPWVTFLCITISLLAAHPIIFPIAPLKPSTRLRLFIHWGSLLLLALAYHMPVFVDGHLPEPLSWVVWTVNIWITDAWMMYMVFKTYKDRRIVFSLFLFFLSALVFSITTLLYCISTDTLGPERRNPLAPTFLINYVFIFFELVAFILLWVRYALDVRKGKAAYGIVSTSMIFIAAGGFYVISRIVWIVSMLPPYGGFRPLYSSEGFVSVASLLSQNICIMFMARDAATILGDDSVVKEPSRV